MPLRMTLAIFVVVAIPSASIALRTATIALVQPTRTLGGV